MDVESIVVSPAVQGSETVFVLPEVDNVTPVGQVRLSVYRVMNNPQIADLIRNATLSPETSLASRVEIARSVGDSVANVVEPWLINNWEVGAMDGYDVIRALHVAETEMYAKMGLSNVMEGAPNKVETGVERSEDVMFGEKVPAHHEDTTELLMRFTWTLDRIMREDPAMLSQEKADMIIAWAHSCLVSIHPFADGNGRTARALANLVGRKLYSNLGKDYTRKAFRTSEDDIPEELDQAYYEAGLLPAENIEKISAEKKGLWQRVLAKLGIKKETRSSWSAFVVNGKDRYFKICKDCMIDHLNTIGSSDDIMTNEGIRKIKKYMQDTNNVVPSKKTRSMAGVIAAEELAQLF